MYSNWLGDCMNIRELRKNTGMTQEQFAERFGIALSTLRRWEQRVSEPPGYLIPLLEQILEVNDRIIIEGKDGDRYYYDPKQKQIRDVLGNSINLHVDLKKVKKDNLKLYVSELFEELYIEKRRFEKLCKEDEKSDIIWIER